MGKTKIDIYSGFLGAGKTTLIKKLLEEKLFQEKVALIENEFGEIGIDGTILKGSNIQVTELTSGCICCTLIGNLEQAIFELVSEYKPERIIMEPSGVAKLFDMIKVCEQPAMQDLLEINILAAVVDVLKYNTYIESFGEFYEDQIKNAKTIILSRTGLAQQELIEEVTAKIQLLNSQASIITTPWENLSAEKILAVAEEVETSLEKELYHEHSHEHHHDENSSCGCHGHHDHNHHHHHHEHDHNHKADEVFSVWGMETPKVFSKVELEDILHNLDKRIYGMVLRGKGILPIKDKSGNDNSWVQFDYVPGEISFKDITPDYTGRVCIIGQNLKKEDLTKVFQG
ncbi:GTP-binding protein [Bacillota bacterium LX-D]|nr:GTP-binding protein [Bacillota bacterium LX-D]